MLYLSNFCLIITKNFGYYVSWFLSSINHGDYPEGERTWKLLLFPEPHHRRKKNPAAQRHVEESVKRWRGRKGGLPGAKGCGGVEAGNFIKMSHQMVHIEQKFVIR